MYRIDKRIIILILACTMLLPGSMVAQASFATPAQHYYRGIVVTAEGEKPSDDYADFGELGDQGSLQNLTVRLLNGPEEGSIVSTQYYHPFASDAVKQRDSALTVGETVVVLATDNNGETIYDVTEPYRLSRIAILFFLFFILTVIVAGRRGVSSIAGLAVSLAIIIWWIIPQIAGGANPLLISFVGSLAIACMSLYLAHGFNTRTSLSLVSTLMTLFLSLGIATFAVSFARLLGLGSEEAYFLTAVNGTAIDYRGLLLGAIIIGSLGVLDDITTTQTATIEELHKANNSMSFRDLYRAGTSVGREHIASLVNTLAIAYVGASLPLFLLLSSADRPLWVILNSEFISEEIIRTLAGSMTLVFAVPIATFIAAYAFTAPRTK